jgi:hypothetical protein
VILGEFLFFAAQSRWRTGMGLGDTLHKMVDFHPAMGWLLEERKKSRGSDGSVRIYR